jgi:hypothetical protein
MDGGQATMNKRIEKDEVKLIYISNLNTRGVVLAHKRVEEIYSKYMDREKESYIFFSNTTYIKVNLPHNTHINI